MSRGKYSPYCTSDAFIYAYTKVGDDGCSVELDAQGFDSYGYDENGRDRAGNTEWDYLADEDLYNHHIRLSGSC